MEYIGQISKMSSELKNTILYHFNIGDDSIEISNQLGKNIEISFDGGINCVECGVKIKKTFMQGFCYRCFITSPRTSECIFKPHLCRAHLGEARDMEWSKKNCLIEQHVYLSLTSNLKVGVTKDSQIPTRWIDQGAHQSIKFAKVPNRYLAGMIEVEISKHISDRTNWRKMLQGECDDIDLKSRKIELGKLLQSEYHQYLNDEDTVIDFNYPKLDKLDKIKSINMEKTPKVKGVLTGIKGQYLMLDNLYVLNVRKYTGYHFTVKIN